MPSMKNPNGPSQNRLAARLATARKHSAKSLARKVRTEQHKITKADARRGARAGLLPTSGPNAAPSSKKQRKLQRRLGYALKRKMEGEGEVIMKDIADDEKPKAKKQESNHAESMAVDTDIS
ncbi:hypothetical protein GGR50DRAFT_72466 [Xylaria sp. CBS 124048]|nr:hypothetical protein GGR50DRAFT_72466 [Xylaria sp. CBS 124048]